MANEDLIFEISAKIEKARDAFRQILAQANATGKSAKTIFNQLEKEINKSFSTKETKAFLDNLRKLTNESKSFKQTQSEVNALIRQRNQLEREGANIQARRRGGIIPGAGFIGDPAEVVRANVQAKIASQQHVSRTTDAIDERAVRKRMARNKADVQLYLKQKLQEEIGVERASKKVIASQKAEEQAFRAKGRQAFFSGEHILGAFRRVVQYGAAASVVYGVVNAFKQTVSTVIDLETAFTRLKRVAPDEKTFAGLQQSSFAIARQYGLSPKEVSSAFLKISAQYKKPSESIQVAQAGAKLSVLAQTDFSDSVDNLIASLQQFDIPASDAVKLIDRIAFASKNTSVAEKDLIEAIASSGAIAKTAGFTLEDYISIVSRVAAASNKSGKEISAMFNRLIANIDKPQVEEFLRGFGVQIRQPQTVSGIPGELRPFKELLPDISSLWGKLSDDQRKSFSELIAGSRQIQNITTLMQQYSFALEDSIGLTKSSGEADRQVVKMLNTTKKSWDELKASVSEFMFTFGKTALPHTQSFLKDLITITDEAKNSFSISRSEIEKEIELIKKERNIIMPSVFTSPLQYNAAGIMLARQAKDRILSRRREEIAIVSGEKERPHVKGGTQPEIIVKPPKPLTPTISPREYIDSFSSSILNLPSLLKTQHDKVVGLEKEKRLQEAILQTSDATTTEYISAQHRLEDINNELQNTSALFESIQSVVMNIGNTGLKNIFDQLKLDLNASIKDMDRLFEMAAAGLSIGGGISSAQGRKGFGGAIGGLGGALGATLALGTAAIPVVGPIVAGLGGIFGGLFGSMLDSEEKTADESARQRQLQLAELQKQQDKLQAIERNTRPISDLMEELINAPAGFTFPIPRGILSAGVTQGGLTGAFGAIPQMASGGNISREGLAYLHAGETVVPAGGMGSVSFVINGAGDPEMVANKVMDKLQSVYRTDRLRSGNFNRRIL